jgi:pimeloyl-ACP methyl ester carboxylesterase
MAMNVICVRPTPAMLGQPDTLPLASIPLQMPVARLPLVMPESQPLFISDFPLSRISTQYWLATLARATYSSGGALFTQAARAVAPESYPVTFVPNAAGFVPGYGIVKFPDFLLVVISGTTNLNQWLAQIFLNSLVPASYPIAGTAGQGQTMALYKAAADAIDTAIVTAAGNDKPVLLCGHSMGGAVATLLHYKYRRQTAARKPSRCLTFAAPKPGDLALSQDTRTASSVLRRLTIQGDAVPGLPPALPKAMAFAVPALLVPFAFSWAEYTQPGSLYYVRDDGSQQVGDEVNLPLFVAGTLIQVGLGRPVNPSALHLMAAYVARFRSNFGNALPAAETSRWNNPGILQQVNDTLTAAGL